MVTERTPAEPATGRQSSHRSQRNLARTAHYRSLSEHSNSGFAEQEHESSLSEDLFAPASMPRICALFTGFA
ncbi:hypothetical protein QL285_027948 [Trifolium repens]|nr:hypothetical protein QL285_027948 [Trifolium repens]